MNSKTPPRQSIASSASTWRNREYINERCSSGLACCRFNENRPEILMVCKRYTYAFYMFVTGQWNPNNNEEIIKLLNQMTIDEKYDLLSLNYIQIWYRVWLSTTNRDTKYYRSKNKFENTFVADNGRRLRDLISKSTHAEKIWEIPKGKKKYKTESDIHCAIREFYEETGISKKSYKIYPNSNTYTFVDAGTRYTTKYFLAFTKFNIAPYVNFGRQEQLEEVSDIRWMTIEDIRRIDTNKRLEAFIKPIFGFMKKYAKR